MKDKIEAILAEIESLECKTENEIEEARVRLLGKKGEITRCSRSSGLSPRS